MFDLLNGLPIIGHVKAVVHLASGDFRNAGKAFYAASRTTAVMAGGAVGIVGGPGAMLAGATGAGFLADSIATVATGSAQGILDGANDIIIDVSKGYVPVKSVFKTGLYVGADFLSGLGGATLSNMTNTIFIGKETVIELAKPACQVVAAGSLTRNIAESLESDSAPRSFYSHSERQKSSPPAKKPAATGSRSSAAPSGTPRGNKSEGTTKSSTTSVSGSQPPEDDKPTYKKEQEIDQNDSHMTVFLKIFNVLYLEDITVGGVYAIFVDLKTGQKKSLKKLINQLRMNGCLVRVIETVRYLFYKMNPQDVSFQNFLSLTQFVATYLGERAACRAEYMIYYTDLWLVYKIDTRKKISVESAANDILASDEYHILTVFKQLYSQISMFTCVPSFRNVFSAIYHYYKHKAIPEMDAVLSVPQYFGLITLMLHKVRTSKEYAELTDPAHARRELVFDRVFSAFGRRVRVVLKMQDGQLELSSCYILDVLFKDDQDSDEFIDNTKQT